MTVEPRTIYVADDDPAFRHLVKMSLIGVKDIEISQYSDGLEVLRAAQDRKPDLLIVDIILPRLEGLAVVRLLKFDPATWNLPIVVMSSVIDTDVEDQIRRVQADEYVRKPFDPAKLRDTVVRLLANGGQ